MHPLLQKLSGGDRRSIGRSEEVVSDICQQPALFAVLIEGVNTDDPVIRMRASDAMEKISRVHPEFLLPYKKRLMDLAAAATQKEVRWHLAQMLPRLPLNHWENAAIVDLLASYLNDDSRIVKTFVMQAMADIAAVDEQLRPALLAKLQALTDSGTPAMRARGRKLITQLLTSPDKNAP